VQITQEIFNYAGKVSVSLSFGYPRQHKKSDNKAYSDKNYKKETVLGQLTQPVVPSQKLIHIIVIKTFNLFKHIICLAGFFISFYNNLSGKNKSIYSGAQTSRLSINSG